MYSIDKIHGLRTLAIMHNLDMPDSFKNATDETIRTVYNGCGPDHFNSVFDWLAEHVFKVKPDQVDDVLRDKLTAHYAFFEAAFMIHDWDFQNSDGTESSFHTANKRLYANCKRLVAALLSWWKEPIAKAKREIQCWNIFTACERFGLEAWQSAHAPITAESGAV